MENCNNLLQFSITVTLMSTGTIIIRPVETPNIDWSNTFQIDYDEFINPLKMSNTYMNRLYEPNSLDTLLSERMNELVKQSKQPMTKIIRTKYTHLPNRVIELIINIFGECKNHYNNCYLRCEKITLKKVCRLIRIINDTLDILMPSITIARQASIEIRELEERYKRDLEFERSRNRSLLDSLLKKDK